MLSWEKCPVVVELSWIAAVFLDKMMEQPSGASISYLVSSGAV